MYHYRIYFTKPGKPSVAYRSVHATNPVMALDHFHTRMQLTEGQRPGDYAVTRLTQIYPGIQTNLKPSFAHVIEAEVDLPRSTNPDFSAKLEPPNHEQTAFPFGVE